MQSTVVCSQHCPFVYTLQVMRRYSSYTPRRLFNLREREGTQQVTYDLQHVKSCWTTSAIPTTNDTMSKGFISYKPLFFLLIKHVFWVTTCFGLLLPDVSKELTDSIFRVMSSWVPSRHWRWSRYLPSKRQRVITQAQSALLTHQSLSGNLTSLICDNSATTQSLWFFRRDF